MDDKTRKDNETLIKFWNTAFAMSEEEKEEYRNNLEDWKNLAPSEKLYHSASFLGAKKKVLDYGCGNAWAGIIAAKNGCSDVTAVDVSDTAAESARFFSELYAVEDRVHISCVSPDWLSSVPDKTFDGIICSNVIDVVPQETADYIIKEFARIAAEDATIIIGMNYYMSSKEAAERGIELVDRNKVYMDGVLRLVSRSDDEWKEIFSQYFKVEKIDHFSWLGEVAEKRRIFISSIQ